MSEDLIIMLAAGGGIIAAVMAVGGIFTKKQSRASERLRELGGFDLRSPQRGDTWSLVAA